MAAPPVSPANDTIDMCAALSDDLGWALGTVFRAYIKAAGVAFADLPGGPRGYQVLAAASAGGAATQLALANQLGVDRTVMTYLIDDLEQAGLIARRPDPSDRRVRRIVTTQAGDCRLAEFNQRLKQAEDQLLSGLTEPERVSLRTLLGRVAMDPSTVTTPVDACQAAIETGVAEHPPTAGPRRRQRAAGRG
jgi:DNA-binding MarR family transcriptional regulator